MADRMTTKAYLEMIGQKKQSKYKNKKIVIDGITFDSMAEGKYYEYLKLLQGAGEVSYFLMQAPFVLEGGVRYRLDFLVVYSDGHIDHVDVKGAVTQVFKIKKKQVEARYPVKIRCLFRKGNRFVEKSV